MRINVQSPISQTIIFGVILLVVIILSIRKNSDKSLFPLSTTQELKGLSILGITFSHIGYFLSNNNQFLYPLSIDAGVGVNLFLFLSGFGLTMSSFKKKLSLFKFYKKRLSSLFIPLWIALSVFIILDFYVLKKTYPLSTLYENYLGFFPSSDLFSDLNSPLWFFTLIFFYYLTFPIYFFNKLIYFIFIIFSLFIFQINLPVSSAVQPLYQLHDIAFPMGVLAATIFSALNFSVVKKINQKLFILITYFKSKLILDLILLIIFGSAFYYFSINSGVGQGVNVEQPISIVTMCLVILFFIFKNFSIKFFNFVGEISYGVYLIHWPILSRYNFLYQVLPPAFTTLIYFGLIFLLGILLEKATLIIRKRTNLF